MAKHLLLYLIGFSIGIIVAKVSYYIGTVRRTKKALRLIGRLDIGSTIHCPLCGNLVAPVPIRHDDIVTAILTICNQCRCASTILPPGLRLQDIQFTKREVINNGKTETRGNR